MSDAATLLDLETLSARIAASLDARPTLGALWHRLVAPSEAAASLSLENIPVSESDILRPDLALGPGAGEPQAMRVAQSIHRLLLAPPSLDRDPSEAFDHAVLATRMTEMLDPGQGGRVAYPEMGDSDERARNAARFAEGLRALGRPASVILGAIGAARVAQACLPEPQPMTERLVFCLAEHGLRRPDTLSSALPAGGPEGLDRRVTARWVLSPSAGLARGGLRSWNILDPEGQSLLLARLRKAARRDIGRLGPLQEWERRIEDEFRGQTAKSRKTAFGSLLRRVPILNAQSVARALDITERGALKLISEATEAGLLVLITPRRSYRLWAAPALAETLSSPTSVSKPARSAPIPQARPPVSSPPIDDGDFDDRVSRILDEVDAAMADLDRVLDRYAGRQADRCNRKDSEDLPG